MATYLRAFADQLDRTDPGVAAEEETDEGRVTLIVGTDSATISPPETVRLVIGVESDCSLVGTGVEGGFTVEITRRAVLTEVHDESENQ